MNPLRLLLLPAALLAFPMASSADDDERHRHRHRHGDFSEEYRDRGCKVKRKMEKDGDYKEEIECGRHWEYRGMKYEREFFEGGCKVKQKMEDGGKYKEERECKASRHPHPPAPAYVPQPVYVPAPQLPPVTEPGIVIQGTVRIR